MTNLTKIIRLEEANKLLEELELLDPQLFDALYDAGSHINGYKANFPWETIVSGNAAWQVFEENTSLLLAPFLYAIITQEAIDFIQQRLETYQGMRRYFLVVAAMGLIKYIGLSYRNDMARIMEQTAAIRAGIVLIHAGVPIDEIPGSQRRQYTIAEELLEANEVHQTYVVKLPLGQNMPKLMCHEAENALNNRIFVARELWERNHEDFLPTFSRNRHSNVAGKEFHQYLVETANLPCSETYVGNACGFALAAKLVQEIAAGHFTRMPIEELLPADVLDVL